MMIEGLIKKFPFKVNLRNPRKWCPHIQNFNSESICNVKDLKDPSIENVRPGLAVRNMKNGHVLFKDNNALVYLFNDTIPIVLGEKFIHNRYYREKLVLIPDGTEVTFDEFLIFIKQGNELVLKPHERYCLLEGTELRFEI